MPSLAPNNCLPSDFGTTPAFVTLFFPGILSAGPPIDAVYFRPAAGGLRKNLAPVAVPGGSTQLVVALGPSAPTSGITTNTARWFGSGGPITSPGFAPLTAFANVFGELP